MMRFIYILLFISITSCVKEERLRSVEKHILKQRENIISIDILIYGDSNVDVLKRTNKIDRAIYLSYKGKSCKNIPVPNERNDKVKWVFFCIGTNDSYISDTNSFKRIYKSFRRFYPNSKIYCVSGTHGWGNSKTTPIKYMKFYRDMLIFGFEPILVPYEIAYFKTSYKAHKKKQQYHYYIIDSIQKVTESERR